MTERFTLEALVTFLDGDREVVDGLERAGFIERHGGGTYSAEEIEHARIAHVLLRELEVNWAGVEVILRMRTELLVTRRRLAEVAELVRGRDR
jgi:DNA-binding FadR family transcriptional regulator